ncbi:MAG TPA: monovalent cation/H+ antiporter complex subunit F [Ilumatobacter sp.]|nr:monovalent cation/H+ antiporter complex subunit F [Ilumatobacter sp.]
MTLLATLLATPVLASSLTSSLMVWPPLVILAVAALLFTYRLLVGPTLPDRIIALDGLLAAVLAGILVGAAISESTVPIIAVLLVALVGFVATGALARYVERRGG